MALVGSRSQYPGDRPTSYPVGGHSLRAAPATARVVGSSPYMRALVRRSSTGRDSPKRPVDVWGLLSCEHGRALWTSLATPLLLEKGKNMVLITTSWRMWLAGLAVSLAVFGVLYFTVIRPDNNTANQAIKSGRQQSQQALNQAQQQLSETHGQTGVASSKAQQELSKASKLSACVAAAGTDATKLQACKTQFAK